MVNLEKLFEVYEFARNAHGAQKRKTGELYITHPVAVANIAQKYGADDEVIYACFLHDVVEDIPVSLGEIKVRFGRDIAYLVDGVTKIEGDKSATLLKVRDYAMSDRRVAMVKLADRIHNISIPINDLRWEKKYSKSTEFYIGLGRGLYFGDMVSRLEELNERLKE